MSQSKARVYIAGVTMCVIFGSAFIAMKIALQTINPLMIIFFRYLLAVAVLHIIYSRMNKKEKIAREDYKALLLLGFLEPILFFIFDAYGLKFTTAIRASILLSIIPVMTAFLALPVLKEKLSSVKILATVCSIFGVYLVVSTKEPEMIRADYLLGDLLIVGACIIAAVYTVLARKLSFKYSFFTITRVQASIAAIGFIPLALGESLITDIPEPELKALFSVIYLGIVSSAFGYMLLNYTISKLSAANSSIFTNLIPAVTMGLSVLILGEYVGLRKITGLLIVSFFVFLLTWYERKR